MIRPLEPGLEPLNNLKKKSVTGGLFNYHPNRAKKNPVYNPR